MGAFPPEMTVFAEKWPPLAPKAHFYEKNVYLLLL
jgi:hypothetical protein